MAARLDPLHVQATHQSLHHFVAKAPWDDQAVLDVVLRRGAAGAPARSDPSLDPRRYRRRQVRPALGRRRPPILPASWARKKIVRSAVSLSLANEHASLPVAFHLYLPEEWADDPGAAQGRCAGRRPGSAPSPRSLWSNRPGVAADLPRGIVLGDPAYGNDTDFRTASRRRAFSMASASSPPAVWPPGLGPLPPKPWSGKGRPAKLLRREAGHSRFRPRRWPRACRPRPGGRSAGARAAGVTCSRRFAAVRVRPAHRDTALGRAASCGMAADRVAGGRRRADQILALDAAEDTALEDLVTWSS